jgi:hypothetical protein
VTAAWSETKGRKNRALATERQAQALALHKAGVGYQSIANRLGYAGPSGAYKAVEAALHKTLQEPAEELRQLELERLDRMHEAVWPRAIAGHLPSIDRVLRCMARRARLLGLDAPKWQHLTSALPLCAYAERVARELGLDPGEVLVEAERLLQSMRNHSASTGDAGA